jgi:hypothetical protein
MRTKLLAVVGLTLAAAAMTVGMATSGAVGGRAAGIPPTASITPGSVEQGDPVTVAWQAGEQCPNSPIVATVTATSGGDPIIDDEEQTTGDAEGVWSYEIDTTELAPGTYTVNTRCVLADGQGFDYNVLTFVVTAAPPPPPAEEPEVPAEPAPAEPDFTG